MKRVILILIFSISFTAGFAQLKIANDLNKNVNIRANELDERLNKTKDSLILENEKLFSKVKFFNDNFEKIFRFEPATHLGKIALSELPLGAYSVMFFQEDKIIVFSLKRKANINNVVEPAKVSENSLATLEDNEEFIADTKYAVSIGRSSAEGNKGDSDTAITVDELVPLDGVQKNSVLGKNNKQVKTNKSPKSSASYNLSNLDRENVQTREEYRKTHLRPNGKPYDDN